MPFLVAAGRVLTGAHPDGKLRTDAGWFRPGSEPLTRTGHALRYWHRPRAHRAVINLLVIAGVLEVAWGWIHHRTVTEDVLAAAAAAWLARGFWRLTARRRRRTWVVPLHLRTHEIAGIPKAAAAASWITVEVDGNAVQAAYFTLPQGWPADDKDKQRLVAIASATCGLEAPEVSWRLAGPDPRLTLERSQPPPARVSLADIRDAIDRAGRDELVWGLGKKNTVVSTSLADDSPHLGLSIGSGGGKSATARALAAQRAYRGDIVLILDIKMISHQWAKGLPNVHIARRPHEIHRALTWLGAEVDRRNEVALAGADIEGNVHSVVGPRLIVVCEELNATMRALRRYWQQLGGEGRSPALDALDATSFMGRQVLVNLIYIGQRLSVKAIGGDGDARENIGVLGFCRYSPSNWKMLAGDFPMPAKSLQPGRLQVVSDKVRETQCVFMSAREARALSVAGAVTPLPAGMPGAGVAGETRAPINGPEQGFEAETKTPLRRPGGPMRLSEAVAEGVVSLKLGALRKASQRDKNFPARRGLDGVAGLYDAAELKEWEATR